MTPTGWEHGLIEGNLGSRLRDFVRDRRLGWVLVGEVGIYTRFGPDRVRGADIAVLTRRRSAEKPASGFLRLAPEVVVEVVSPEDRWQDVRQKLDEYFEVGVEQVWVVEPQDRTVVVYRTPTEGNRYGAKDTISGWGALDGFALEVGSIFEE